MHRIAQHTMYLSRKLYAGLVSLCHSNGSRLCQLYSLMPALDKQGPIVAFNLQDEHGAPISNMEFVKQCSNRNIHVRAGGHCNPGGVASSLNLDDSDIERIFTHGYKCGITSDIFEQKPTGAIRVSLGAMSTSSDVETFLAFVSQTYLVVSPELSQQNQSEAMPSDESTDTGSLQVKSITIYPIKSCAGMDIPAHKPWKVNPEGLEWDREWCLIHQSTRQVLSQKRYPRMALIRATIDLEHGLLRVTCDADNMSEMQELQVPLTTPTALDTEPAKVCGEAIFSQTYADAHIGDFFTTILATPCTLARFPAGGTGLCTRRSASTADSSRTHDGLPPILLPNTSPLLLITTASLNQLNASISASPTHHVSASVFRPNIVLAHSAAPLPWAEESWTRLSIGAGLVLRTMGKCKRCEMINVDQRTGERRRGEPMTSLARLRAMYFGVHACLADDVAGPTQREIRVGNRVLVETSRT